LGPQVSLSSGVWRHLSDKRATSGTDVRAVSEGRPPRRINCRDPFREAPLHRALNAVEKEPRMRQEELWILEMRRVPGVGIDDELRIGQMLLEMV